MQLDDAVYNAPFITPDFNKTDNRIKSVELVETITEKKHINTTYYLIYYTCLIPVELAEVHCVVK